MVSRCARPPERCALPVHGRGGHPAPAGPSGAWPVLRWKRRLLRRRAGPALRESPPRRWRLRFRCNRWGSCVSWTELFEFAVENVLLGDPQGVGAEIVQREPGGEIKEHDGKH